MVNKKVITAVEKFFAPDITVLVDSDSIIVSRRALTSLGHKYLASHGVLGEDYDTVLHNSGLCIESKII